MEAPVLPEFTNDFTALLDQVAQKLARHLIDTTGTNYVEVAAHNRTTFDAPPLWPHPSILGVPVHRIPLMLYGAAVTKEQVLVAWNRDMAMAIRDDDVSAVNAIVRRVLPDHRFSGNAAERAARFIYIVGMGGRPFTPAFGASTAVLKVKFVGGVLKLGIDDDEVLWVTSHAEQGRRSARTLPLDINHVMSEPMAARRQSKQSTGGLYVRLLATMPDLADDLHYIFSAAVAAGPDFEDRLLAPFDWVLNREAFDTVDDVWKQATEIVQRAKHNPTHELYRLLRVRVGYGEFKAAFGDPHRHPGDYRPATRRRHLAALAQLQSTVPQHSPVSAANEMLDLQRLIGSIPITGRDHV